MGLGGCRKGMDQTGGKESGGMFMVECVQGGVTHTDPELLSCRGQEAPEARPPGKMLGRQVGGTAHSVLSQDPLWAQPLNRRRWLHWFFFSTHLIFRVALTPSFLILKCLVSVSSFLWSVFLSVFLHWMVTSVCGTTARGPCSGL